MVLHYQLPVTDDSWQIIVRDDLIMSIVYDHTQLFFIQKREQ